MGEPDFSPDRAIAALRSRQFKALFLTELRWAAPASPQTIISRVAKQPYRAHLIAQRGEASVWHIALRPTAPLTATVRSRLMARLRPQSPHPLLIFEQGDSTLWHWQLGSLDLPQSRVPQSRVHVTSQPDTFWQPRLRQLWAYSGQGHPLLSAPPPQTAELTAGYQDQIQQLSTAIVGIDSARDRIAYARLLMARLLAIALMQQQGLLNGDVWYLHSALGQSQQRGPDQFFNQVLQPLFYQGFSLPPQERSPQVQRLLGQVPYLGTGFDRQPLEIRHPHVHISDAPFESALVWLGNFAWAAGLNPWGSATVGLLLEQEISAPLCSSTAIAASLDVLDHTILQQLGSQATLADVLFKGEQDHCRRLIQEVLPQLTVLDPACSSGRFLVAALQHLIETCSSAVGHLERLQDPHLAIWLSGLEADYPSLLQGIGRRLLRSAIYGVDRCPEAVALARLQLRLVLVGLAHTAAEVTALPGLEFNVMTGNSLVGLIRVDEDGFERGRGKQAEVLQGNLLQPLAADSYRTILAEKKIGLEHYQSQTLLLQESPGVPPYAQREFLLDNIRQLDQQAQTKLNELLLWELNQLGIQYKETQLQDRPERRAITLADLEMLMPFHWGYAFNAAIERGGFDVIVSAPPWGRYRPTVAEFFQYFPDLAQTHSEIKTTKQALLDTDLELAEAWLFYQSQFSFVTEYFRRAQQYAHQGEGRYPRIDGLFVEQCANLLAPGGGCALVVPENFQTAARTGSLRAYLNQSGRVASTRLPQETSSACCQLYFYKSVSQSP